MASLLPLRSLNPLRIFRPEFKYQALPADSTTSSPHLPYLERLPSWPIVDRLPKSSRRSLARIAGILLTCIIAVVLFAVLGRRAPLPSGLHDEPPMFDWMHFRKMKTYTNGIRTLMSHTEYTPANRYNESIPPEAVPPESAPALPQSPPVDPVMFNPYTNHDGQIQTCYLHPQGEQSISDIFAYPGVPVDMPVHQFGSYDAIGLDENVCFDRFGRLAAYGYGLHKAAGGLFSTNDTESEGSDQIYAQMAGTDMSNVDWGRAQRRCYDGNKARFEEGPANSKPLPRQAFVLRVWTGYQWGSHQILTMRAMIAELNLRSGGEYDVHLLLHVKDNTIPIWADEDIYRSTLESNIPREFWNLTTLWSEAQMRLLYPAAFDRNFAGMVASNIHGVYRSPHFALQWFAKQHPEYEFFWNWEMDLRFTGHYYEFLSKIDSWAKEQPRKGMWERGSRFYIPAKHGSYHQFTKFVEEETMTVDVPKNNVEAFGPLPVWGPVYYTNSSALPPPAANTPPTSYEDDAYTWGVNEPADFLSFNPLFQPETTNWVFRNDITGWDLDHPRPPRRSAIITVGRLSKRLLETMHREVFQEGHTMFPEMFPPTVAFQHGYKALFVPHPVYFENDWPTERMDQTFNHPMDYNASPFGWGEHNMMGGTFYYNSRFAQDLWQKWLGTGRKEEEESGTGRLCLKSMLFHPIKQE